MDQIDLYYEVTRERLLNQGSLDKEFGTKASSRLGLGAALIGAATIILNLSDIKLGLGIPALWVFIVLVVAFVCTAVLSFLVLFPRDWEHGPTVYSLANALGHYEDRDLTKLVGDEYKQAVDSNWRILDQKACFLTCGVVAIAIEAGALAALGILRAWSP